MLTLPLWFITERNPRAEGTAALREDPGAILGFTSMEKLAAFLSKQQAGEWKLQLTTDRDGLVLIVAIAHNNGAETICFDSEPDGSGGRQVTLSELLVLSQSLR